MSGLLGVVVCGFYRPGEAAQRPRAERPGGAGDAVEIGPR